MREDRTPATSRGANQPTDDAQQTDRSVGFRRHTSGNARRSGSARTRTPRPQQAAEAAEPQAERPEDVSPSPRAVSRGGDYLGTGRPCRVCGKPVDPSQTRCPHCGAFQKPLYANPPFIAAAVAGVALVALLSVGINSCAANGTGTDGGSSTPNAAANQEDKTALTGAMASAQAYVDENTASPTYTAASIAALQSAMASAQTVVDDAGASAEQIAQAASDVTTAQGNLVLRPVAFGNSYDWPWYDPLVETLTTDPSYVGTQIAMEGVITSVQSGTDGSVALMASSGDVTCLIQVTSTNFTDLTGVDGALAQDSHVEVAGTVTGLVEHDNGDGTTSQIPAITADFIQYYTPVE